MTDGGRVYLDVAWRDRWYVKQLGARWDPVLRLWWIRPSCRDYRLTHRIKEDAPHHLPV